MNKLNAKQLEEARDLLQEAQDRMEDALQALKSYLKLTDDRHTKAYLVDHLECMTSSNHGFLSRDVNIDTVREGLEEEQEDWAMEEEAEDDLSPAEELWRHKEEEDDDDWNTPDPAEDGMEPLPRYHDDMM